MSSRGIVLFGINNEHIDYVQLAIMCAAFIRKNMPNINIALITDENSKNAQESKNEYLLDSFFDRVILVPNKDTDIILFDNVRAYRDTRYHSVNAHFKNESRSSIYDLSPFEETLLIDADYLVMNDALNCVWGSTEDFLINKQATSLLHHPLSGEEFRISPYGIRMYWATVIYFRKCKKSKLIFDLVGHIKENWEYYVLLYEIPGKLYRNDYAFSIAIHILNTSLEGDIVKDLPIPSIHTALDLDQFYKIKSPNELLFFINDLKETWKFYVTNIKGINVHCMNKISLINNMNSIMKVLA